jgi:hypothetical protein
VKANRSVNIAHIKTCGNNCELEEKQTRLQWSGLMDRLGVTTDCGNRFLKQTDKYCIHTFCKTGTKRIIRKIYTYLRVL